MKYCLKVLLNSGFEGKRNITFRISTPKVEGTLYDPLVMNTLLRRKQEMDVYNNLSCPDLDRVTYAVHVVNLFFLVLLNQDFIFFEVNLTIPKTRYDRCTKY